MQEERTALPPPQSLRQSTTDHEGSRPARHLNSPVSAPSSASSRYRRHDHVYHDSAGSSQGPHGMGSYGLQGPEGPFIYRGIRKGAGGQILLRTGFVNQIESDDELDDEGAANDSNEFNKRTKLTFLTESGNFHKSENFIKSAHDGEEEEEEEDEEEEGDARCEEGVEQAVDTPQAMVRPHTVADCRPAATLNNQPAAHPYTRDTRRPARPATSFSQHHLTTVYSIVPEFQRSEEANGCTPTRTDQHTPHLPDVLPHSHGSVTFISTPRPRSRAKSDASTRAKTPGTASSRSLTCLSRAKTPQHHTWGGLREAIYARDGPDVGLPYVSAGAPGAGLYDQVSDVSCRHTASSAPWLDQFMSLRKRMSLQMAMSNSSCKGLRKLGTRQCRRKKNPWKAKEKEIWKKRNTCRVISKPEAEVEIVEPTEEEKLEKIRVARRRLGWVFSMVYWTMHCFNTLVERSCHLTHRSGVEIQWHTIHSNKKLAFNPANFSRTKVNAKMPTWARHILDKPSDSRTDRECRRLHAMMRGYPSFDKFTELIQLAMCRSMEYMYVHSQRIILREGHIGLNFYFVYSGSVFVNVSESSPDGGRFTKTEAVLSKGDSFGELALLQDEPRSATVSCRVDTELLMVDKEVFSQVCPKIFDIEMQDKMKFASTLPLFHTNYWDKDALYKLCFESQIQQYMTNKVICKNSNEDSWLYICIEGLCHIIKCLRLEHDSSSERRASQDDADDDMLTAEFLQTMDKHAARQKGGKNDRRASVNEELFKKRMLDSLSLEYVKTVNKQQKKEEEGGGGLLGYTEELTTNPDAIVTMTTLMRQGYAEGKNNLVYLKVGLLQPGEAFDLQQILCPRRSATSTTGLILVSGGAQMFRVRRAHLHNVISDAALEHAKHIAMKTTYPSDNTLLSSYKEESKWLAYREQVVNETLKQHKDQARRRQLFDYQRAVSSSKRSQDNRLLSILQRNQRKEQQRLQAIEAMKENVPMALDAVRLPNEDDDFVVNCNKDFSTDTPSVSSRSSLKHSPRNGGADASVAASINSSVVRDTSSISSTSSGTSAAVDKDSNTGGARDTSAGSRGSNDSGAKVVVRIAEPERSGSAASSESAGSLASGDGKRQTFKTERRKSVSFAADVKIGPDSIQEVPEEEH